MMRVRVLYASLGTKSQRVDVEALLRGSEPLLKVRLTHLLDTPLPGAPGDAAAAAGGAHAGGCILALTIHHAVMGERVRP